MAERSLLAAVSGIQANQTYLDEIGNNIANADTVGYKEGTVQFGDLLNEQISGATAPTATSGGINPVAVGSGVRVDAVTPQLSEGSLEVTGQPTDVAITGSGYLMVSVNGQHMYTRDGALTVDATGHLTTLTGGQVLGWQATDGTIKTNGPLGPITIPKGETIAAAATNSLTLSGNLPANLGASTTPPTLTYDVYNALGDAIPVTVTFNQVTTGTSVVPNEWTMTVAVTGKTGTPIKVYTTPGSRPVLDFTTSGQLTITTATAAFTVQNGALTLKVTPPTTAVSQYTLTGVSWTFVLPKPGSTGAVTQFAAQQSIGIATSNGWPSGSLETYSIGGDGVITGSFSNGKTEAIGQIALAGFANATGLVDTGNGLMATSPNSGQAQVGQPGTGTLGSLLGGQLEQSNVTMGAQLTDLITAQEAYQANTKVISTTQQAVQSLMAI